MDITQFNKELGIKIAIAKRFETNGDIKAAIQQWLEISELAINFSKSPKIDRTFKNMIINRTKGIFIHIKTLKVSQFKKEKYREDLKTPKEEYITELSPENVQNEDRFMQEEQVNENSGLDLNFNGKSKINGDSKFKNLPKGFKEIETSEDFTIITPHDKEFVKKQRDKVDESEFFKPNKQEFSGDTPKPADRIDLEQPKEGKSLICFACGYDMNALNDKVCKNCGTSLN